MKDCVTSRSHSDWYGKLDVSVVVAAALRQTERPASTCSSCGSACDTAGPVKVVQLPSFPVICVPREGTSKADFELTIDPTLALEAVSGSDPAGSCTVKFDLRAIVARNVDNRTVLSSQHPDSGDLWVLHKPGSSTISPNLTFQDMVNKFASSKRRTPAELRPLLLLFERQGSNVRAETRCATPPVGMSPSSSPFRAGEVQVGGLHSSQALTGPGLLPASQSQSVDRILRSQAWRGAGSTNGGKSIVPRLTNAVGANICFMNTLVQFVLASPALLHSLLSHGGELGCLDPSTSTLKQRKASSALEVIGAVAKNPEVLQDVKTLRSYLSFDSHKFTGTQQCDVADAFCALLTLCTSPTPAPSELDSQPCLQVGGLPIDSIQVSDLVKELRTASVAQQVSVQVFCGGHLKERHGQRLYVAGHGQAHFSVFSCAGIAGIHRGISVHNVQVRVQQGHWPCVPSAVGCRTVPGPNQLRNNVLPARNPNGGP